MKRPTLRELECFVAVAGELSFSRAARRLNLSQPPLSRQIQSLEDRLGCPLLLRNTRAVSLTPAGELFLEDARRILNGLDAAVDAARRTKTGEIFRLRITFVGALRDDAMIHVLRRFRDQYPEWQIQLTDLPPAQQLEALLSGEADAAFVGVAPRTLHRDLQAVIWKREPLQVALPSGHHLAGRKSIALKELWGESWVMVSPDAAPAFRQLFNEACAKASFKARIVQESERVAAVVTMVAANQGISLVPTSVQRLVGDAVVFRPVIPKKQFELAHTCVVKRGVSPAVSGFLKLLKEEDRPAR